MVAFTPTVVAQIQVANLQGSASWLKKNLGWDVSYTVDEMGWGEVSTALNGLSLGLSASGSPAENAVLVFGVEDIAAARGELEGKGVRFEGETEVIPEMVKLATFYDPDGNRFMLAESLMGPE